ncbi:MAG: hypothetical protein ABMA02_18005, partial [Saprospiraceae bacterium]
MMRKKVGGVLGTAKEYVDHFDGFLGRKSRQIIPRTARCEAAFVILSAANQNIRPKAMHKTSQR